MDSLRALDVSMSVQSDMLSITYTQAPTLLHSKHAQVSLLVLIGNRVPYVIGHNLFDTHCIWPSLPRSLPWDRALRNRRTAARHRDGLIFE